MGAGGGGTNTANPPVPSLVSVPRHIISTPPSTPTTTLPPTTSPHSIYPHLSKMKNPSFSSNVQPNIIYTPFPEIEPYLGATGFAICFQISFLHELYFPSTFGQNYNPIDPFSGHHPSTYIFPPRAPLRGAGQFSVSRPGERVQNALCGS